MQLTGKGIYAIYFQNMRDHFGSFSGFSFSDDDDEDDGDNDGDGAFWNIWLMKVFERLDLCKKRFGSRMGESLGLVELPLYTS